MKKIFEKNKDILEDIEKVIEEFVDFDTNSLVKYVHDYEISVDGHEEPVRIGN